MIQPIQVEFSRVLDDQVNFEKTKKDQFRDYKNLIVQDQSKDESRFKVQKRSVYTQPGMPQANAATSNTQSRQQNIQKHPTGESLTLIQSGNINF